MRNDGSGVSMYSSQSQKIKTDTELIAELGER